jgi:hypothetical protein
VLLLGMFEQIVGRLVAKGGVYVSVQTAQRRQRPSCSVLCRDPCSLIDEKLFRTLLESRWVKPGASELSCGAP